MPRQRKLRLEDPLRCKLVIVGCGGVGKTSLLCTYARGEFPEPYVAASFDGYVADVELPLDSIPGLNLEVWERKPGWLRRVKECFSSTFRRIQSLNEEGGLNDLGLNVLNVEMALWDTAGSDDYDRLRPLSYLDAHVFLGEATAQRINALHYFEVSAKRDGVEGIGEVFVTAAKEAVRFRLKLVEEERRGRREGLNRVSGGG
ncbi:hypothetical protein CC1G_03167 [Coprinopsis cinerea okayama7|uniref:Uncharacterized protein n=1 Tax=Coprinopsis cinerea (strain Okayama-7 / 130 / ATCC MYA-4618 / FGSC 9003) TaxID=240176 RepID=A8PF62_COPC7|nr:hypothetical protein CC1G_03167 [Coprinopsis cinerea okayama7\|eukprot:XP_001840938.2 hypothetical protein CC1G_03167 [Coprinopsis cinerea okayama7\